MPPKKKPFKTTKTSPPKLPTDNNEMEGASVILSPEFEEQYEIELCWCIGQLQTALQSGKLNSKQVQDHNKSLKTLTSNTVPMIKKRQVMRLSFGDYRGKMAADEKKSSKKATNMNVKPATPSKKSVFLKKSVFASTSGNEFKFNFDAPPAGHDSNEDASNIQIISKRLQNNETDINENKYHFQPSDNNFRFSFNVHET